MDTIEYQPPTNHPLVEVRPWMIIFKKVETKKELSPDALLTATEVGEILSVHPDTVRRMVRQGEFCAVEIGKREFRIRKSDLDEWLRNGRKRR